MVQSTKGRLKQKYFITKSCADDDSNDDDDDDDDESKTYVAFNCITNNNRTDSTVHVSEDL